MRILQEMKNGNFEGLILEDVAWRDKDRVYLTDQEILELKKFFNKNERDSHYTFYRPGVWLVKEDRDEDLSYLKAYFLENVTEPIKPYPFVSVEKYRAVIENAMVKAFMQSNTINAESVATQIILAISKRIQEEKENHNISKEDFL